MTTLTSYTVPITDGMRVRHDAEARVTVKTGRTVLEDRLTGIASLGGAVTAASVVYNRLAYSGGTSWWNPTTGQSIKRPTITMRVRPQDALSGDQECSCTKCVQEGGIDSGRDELPATH